MMQNRLSHFHRDAKDYKIALLEVIGALGRAYKFLAGKDDSGQSIISRLIALANKIKSTPGLVRSFIDKVKALKNTTLPLDLLGGVFKACNVLAHVSDRLTGDSKKRDSLCVMRKCRDDSGVFDILLKAAGLLSKMLPFLPDGKAKSFAASAISLIGRAKDNESAIRKSIDLVKALLGLSLPNKITFSLGYVHSLLKEAFKRAKGIFA